tara:strand:+ start:16275 stop:17975 length:1701 start_codon:yes stop_codon:yes gene_type:complete
MFLTQVIISQNFEVSVSQNKVGLHETFEISFTLDGSGKNFSPPPFSNFQILRGPSKSSSTSIVNGSMSQELTYTYVLKPKKVGVFTILPASIKSKGKTIGTKPITVQVQKQSAPKKPNTPYDIASRKVHLNVTANKSTCYVGEPIVLTYTLYFNLNVGSLSPNSMKYTNFWANELEVNSETIKRVYKGQNYNSAIIKQVALTPQESGSQSIDPLSINLVVSVPTGRRDFFNMMTSQNIDYTVVANDLRINVLDLPKDGRPTNFSGAIGDFNLSVSLDKDSININESATFSVKIKGKGNLNLINSPKLNFDTQLEVFEPKNSDNIKINQTGVQGYKKEDYLIVPRYRGVYTIQPVNFNFFNPKTKQYVVLNSVEKKIKVGGVQKGEDSYTLQSVNKEQVDLLNEDIKFIKTTYSSSFLKNNFSTSWVFVVLVIIAFIILIIAILGKKQVVNVFDFFRKSISQEISQKLHSLNALLKAKQYQQFQSSLLSILFAYISKRFGIRRGDLSIESIKIALTDCHISDDLISEYIELVEYLERCKYSPHQGDKINKDLYVRAVELIKKIDMQK